MNSTLEAVNGEAGRREATVGSYAYSIGIFFGALIISIAITYSYYCIYGRTNANESSHPNRGHRRRRSSTVSRTTTSTTSSDNDSDSGRVSTGLDEASIHTYPTLLFSKVKSHKGADSGCSGGCSICLQDYTDTDSVRLLPECGHFFHLQCVDPWLRIHPSCPICRNSAMRTPVDNPAAAEVAAAISTHY